MADIGQNTWVTEPKEEEKFYPSRIRKILQELIEDGLKNETYDPANSPVLAENLVKKIRSKIRESINQNLNIQKAQKMPRFKLAIQVFIGEIKGQGCKITSKNLWDPTWDNHATYSFQNEQLYAVAMVFGLYYE